MALYLDIAAELKRRCEQAFAEDSDTGQLVRRFNKFVTDLAETGTNDFDAWRPLQEDFLLYLRGPGGAEWPNFNAAMRENITMRTDYLCVILYLLDCVANYVDDVPVPPAQLNALAALIRERGGNGASMRNEYLSYLHDNIATILTAEVV